MNEQDLEEKKQSSSASLFSSKIMRKMTSFGKRQSILTEEKSRQSSTVDHQHVNNHTFNSHGNSNTKNDNNKKDVNTYNVTPNPLSSSLMSPSSPSPKTDSPAPITTTTTTSPSSIGNVLIQTIKFNENNKEKSILNHMRQISLDRQSTASSVWRENTQNEMIMKENSNNRNRNITPSSIFQKNYPPNSSSSSPGKEINRRSESTFSSLKINKIVSEVADDDPDLLNLIKRTTTQSSKPSSDLNTVNSPTVPRVYSNNSAISSTLSISGQPMPSSQALASLPHSRQTSRRKDGELSKSLQRVSKSSQITMSAESKDRSKSCKQHIEERYEALSKLDNQNPPLSLLNVIRSRYDNAQRISPQHDKGLFGLRYWQVSNQDIINTLEAASKPKSSTHTTTATLNLTIPKENHHHHPNVIGHVSQAPMFESPAITPDSYSSEGLFFRDTQNLPSSTQAATTNLPLTNLSSIQSNRSFSIAAGESNKLDIASSTSHSNSSNLKRRVSDMSNILSMKRDSRKNSGTQALTKLTSPPTQPIVQLQNTYGESPVPTSEEIKKSLESVRSGSTTPVMMPKMSLDPTSQKSQNAFNTLKKLFKPNEQSVGGVSPLISKEPTPIIRYGSLGSQFVNESPTLTKKLPDRSGSPVRKSQSIELDILRQLPFKNEKHTPSSLSKYVVKSTQSSPGITPNDPDVLPEELKMPLPSSRIDALLDEEQQKQLMESEKVSEYVVMDDPDEKLDKRKGRWAAALRLDISPNRKGSLFKKAESTNTAYHVDAETPSLDTGKNGQTKTKKRNILKTLLSSNPPTTRQPSIALSAIPTAMPGENIPPVTVTLPSAEIGTLPNLPIAPQNLLKTSPVIRLDEKAFKAKDDTYLTKITGFSGKLNLLIETTTKPTSNYERSFHDKALEIDKILEDTTKHIRKLEKKHDDTEKKFQDIIVLKTKIYDHDLSLQEDIRLYIKQIDQIIYQANIEWTQRFNRLEDLLAQSDSPQKRLDQELYYVLLAYALQILGFTIWLWFQIYKFGRGMVRSGKRMLGIRQLEESVYQEDTTISPQQRVFTNEQQQRTRN